MKAGTLHRHVRMLPAHSTAPCRIYLVNDSSNKTLGQPCTKMPASFLSLQVHPHPPPIPRDLSIDTFTCRHGCTHHSCCSKTACCLAADGEKSVMSLIRSDCPLPTIPAARTVTTSWTAFTSFL
ncbi:hypothetical protein FQA47_020277 [Oryzias melastigma]|uniref:Uncharacterized protein n=1 Tax=Oryzias melastigma TaxID=30732 RepID=A0A834KYW9_ORYME|nr:hypothetical protein FQA47_020277 [Oryzias melastigma]